MNKFIIISYSIIITRFLCVINLPRLLHVLENFQFNFTLELYVQHIWINVVMKKKSFILMNTTFFSIKSTTIA